MVYGQRTTQIFQFDGYIDETRELPLELSRDRGPDDPVFLSRHHRRLCETQVSNIVKAILDRAGLLKGRPAGSRIATHVLRKTFSTLAYHAGCDNQAVEYLLRHKKRDVMSRYVGMPMDALRRYLERYSPIRLLYCGRVGESVIIT